MRPSPLSSGTVLLLALALPANVFLAAEEADWPAYRADAARSGYAEDPVPYQLRLRWTFRTAPPAPAWPGSDRVDYDLVHQPILVGGLVLFGSSADDRVYALDAATGELRWSYFTEGPVRFAPAAWEGRVFVASDDGHLHALALADGALLWRHRAGPTAERVLGNERLVSRWPARGGPVVRDGIVYYSGGIWPSDGVYVHALDAASGEALWSNGETGGITMPQPHGGADAASGVAPQGYLLAAEDALVVPTGRAVPAVFDRAEGGLRYYHLQKNQHRGGTRTVLDGDSFINGAALFDLESGDLSAQVGAGPVVAVPGGLVRAEGRSLASYRWREEERFDRRGEAHQVRVLELDRVAPLEEEALEFIVTGNEAVVGSDGRVVAIDYRGQRNEWWKHEVEGKALGLAVARGRLAVATDAGVLYLFDADPEAPPAAEPDAGEVAKAPALSPEAEGEALAEAAAILEAAGIVEGYAVVLGAGDGTLAAALAQRSGLHVLAVESDAALAAEARLRLAASGLYGTRASVQEVAPEATAFAPGFADLVVIPAARAGDSALAEEAARLQRPYGGIVAVPGDADVSIDRRGAPEGAGEWTHQNANPANTLCSDDEIVRGRLTMQWYRDVDFEIVNRHGQGPAPLVADGHLVVAGVHGICCLNAHNGRLLWEFEWRDLLLDYDGIHHDVGVGDTGGPLCIGGGAVYVKGGERCLRLDLSTGELLGELRTPVTDDAEDRAWGYLAYADGLLYGSVANHAHNVSPRYPLTSLRTESVRFFAMDPESGELRWSYEPEGSLRHNAIAIGGGRVHLVDRPLVEADRVTEFRRGGQRRDPLEVDELPGGSLLALDAATGELLWRDDEGIWGTQLSVSADHEIVLMNYKAVRHSFFELPSESGGRLAAFDASTGQRLWDERANYETRPVVNDETVYAQGGAWSLVTGSPLPWELERSYGCGQISASRHLKLFRSATLGYVDLTRDVGTENYGGFRPSCWINAIPAVGLVLVPDGSSKCQCSYQMKAWFALRGE